MADEEKVLDLIALMGEHLLLNGAEIARVQDTMSIVAKAFGKENVDVYAVSNGIFVTMNHKQQARRTQVKYVPLSSPNLGKVAAINELSGGICEGKYYAEPCTEADEGHCGNARGIAWRTACSLRGGQRKLLLFIRRDIA